MTDLYNFLDRFNIPNPFDNIVMEGIGFPDVYDRYATAEVKVECYGDGKVNFSAKIGDPSFPEALERV